MKKLLLLVVLSCMTAINALAYDACVDGIYYSFMKGKAFVTSGYTKYSGSIVIPETVTYDDVEYSVTSIGSSAFYGCAGLTSVTIGNSVTVIGSSAFYDCTSLTSVTIGNSVTVIGENAFSNCTGLTSIVVESGNIVYDSRGNCNAIIYTGTNELITGCKNTEIPNSVTSIGEYAFYNCTGLISIEIPNSVTSIGVSAFWGCTGLTSVTIPNSVTSIGEYAFSNCTGLTSVTIPNSVTSIGVDAFFWCKGLTSVTISCKDNDDFQNYLGRTDLSSIFHSRWLSGKMHQISISGEIITSIEIPNTVTSIGQSAFADCTGLTSVTIPESVYSILSSAFSGCGGLTSVEIPNSVTSIGNKAFSCCYNLTSVIIGNSVTSIGELAFNNCTGLTSVTIPNSVTSIGSNAFYNCYSLTSVNIKDLSAWCTIKFESSDANPLYYAHKLYSNGDEIKNLVIPNTVTSIAGSTFYGCSDLTSVTIPKSVYSIGSSAFSDCTGLSSVILGKSIVSIGGSAFSGCKNLEDVYCYAEKVPAINANAFKDAYIEYSKLHVPETSVDLYKNATTWNDFGTIVTLSGEEPTPEPEPEPSQCAAPEISYVNGKFIFSCETDSAVFHYTYTIKQNLKGEGTGDFDTNDIKLTPTITVAVFTTADGYKQSDTVTKTFTLTSGGGSDDVNGDGQVDSQDVLHIYEYMKIH